MGSAAVRKAGGAAAGAEGPAGGWEQELPVPDFHIQPRRLGCWFHTQFLRQQSAAGLVLRQSGASLPNEGQQAHQLALRVFPPGHELYLAPGKAQGTLVITARLVILHEAVQAVQRQPSEPLAL